MDNSARLSSDARARWPQSRDLQSACRQVMCAGAWTVSATAPKSTIHQVFSKDYVCFAAALLRGCQPSAISHQPSVISHQLLGCCREFPVEGRFEHSAISIQQ